MAVMHCNFVAEDLCTVPTLETITLKDFSDNEIATLSKNIVNSKSFREYEDGIYECIFYGVSVYQDNELIERELNDEYIKFIKNRLDKCEKVEIKLNTFGQNIKISSINIALSGDNEDMTASFDKVLTI